jgi:hypothetical protein
VNQSKKVQLWLSVVYSIQILTLLVADALLTSRLGAISQRLRDSLYSAGETTEQVDKVNQTLFAIGNDTHWLMIALMFLSIISFGFLFLLTKERPGKQNPPLDSKDN